ncbi:hypothetical protein GCM10009625_08470 [Brachybacterium fresconis]
MQKLLAVEVAVMESIAQAQVRVASQLASSLRGRQGAGAPVRREFVLSPDKQGAPSPLITVISAGSRGRGGPGGRVRLGLLLSSIWVAGSRSPFETFRTPSMWAELLGLPDPTTAGARSVRNAQRTLVAQNFFAEPTGAGRETRRIKLLREDGSGRDYTIPTGAKEQNDLYFRVPEVLWTQGVIARLETPGLTMLLAALSVSRWDGEAGSFESVVFRPKTSKEVFGISDATRKRGLQELVMQGVLLDLSTSGSAHRLEGMPRNESKHYRLSSTFRPMHRP